MASYRCTRNRDESSQMPNMLIVGVTLGCCEPCNVVGTIWIKLGGEELDTGCNTRKGSNGRQPASIDPERSSESK